MSATKLSSDFKTNNILFRRYILRFSFQGTSNPTFYFINGVAILNEMDPLHIVMYLGICIYGVPWNNSLSFARNRSLFDFRENLSYRRFVGFCTFLQVFDETFFSIFHNFLTLFVFK